LIADGSIRESEAIVLIKAISGLPVKMKRGKSLTKWVTSVGTPFTYNGYTFATDGFSAHILPAMMPEVEQGTRKGEKLMEMLDDGLRSKRMIPLSDQEVYLGGKILSVFGGTYIDTQRYYDACNGDTPIGVYDCGIGLVVDFAERVAIIARVSV